MKIRLVMIVVHLADLRVAAVNVELDVAPNVTPVVIYIAQQHVIEHVMLHARVNAAITHVQLLVC